MKPLISLVIPVYNVQAYLRRCIDSVLAQTYENMEILLVDDGSTDNSGALCDAYAQRDKRVRVLHKTNGGLSDARNVGIEAATGLYLSFADSDDFLAPTYLQHLYDALQRTGARMAISRLFYFRETEQVEKVLARQKAFASGAAAGQVTLLNAQQALENMLYQREISPGAFAKLYYREDFTGIRYPKGKLYEDIVTTDLLIDRCKTVALLNEWDYLYLQRAGGIQGSPFRLQKMDLITHVEQVARFIQDKYPAIYPAATCKCASAYFNIYFQIPKENAAFAGQKEALWRRIKAIRGQVLRDRQARNKTRMACLLSYGGRTISSLLYQFMNRG